RPGLTEHAPSGLRTVALAPLDPTYRPTPADPPAARGSFRGRVVPTAGGRTQRRRLQVVELLGRDRAGRDRQHRPAQVVDGPRALAGAGHLDDPVERP